MAQGSPWWAPERYADRRGRLVARQRIAGALRSYFEARGFIESAVGSLTVSPGNETHLHGLKAEVADIGGKPHQLYLHTSPEFAMKKLLAAGEPRLFELARVFRGREGGPLNAAEFTMLEWYRANEPYEAVIDDCLAILRLAGETAGISELRYRGRVAKLATPARRLTVAEAFRRHAAIDLLATIDESGTTDRDALCAAVGRAGVRTAANDTWSDLFSRVMAEHIEPALADGIVILDQYPRPEAALARVSPQDRRVAERFEIYACGVELANGFGELTDAKEQRRRFDADMEEKQRRYGERYPIDEELLAALAVMPPASGVALGFDRLVVLSTNAHEIGDVMWTPPVQLE